jgi:signal transduction histidine kinase
MVVVAISLTAAVVLPRIEDGGTRAGLARTGDDLTLVIVSDAGVDAAARDLLRLGLWVPVIALIPALGLAWLIAGRIDRIEAEALLEVEKAEEDRQKRLEEVVHELRTPLAVIGTNLELALSEEGPGDTATFVGAARRAVERMARTVDDLEGHGGLAVDGGGEPLDLASVAEGIAAEHLGPAQARGIEVVLVGTGEVGIPRSDPAAVRTSVGNLMANATRLAPRGSTVTIDWGVHGEWAWIAVSDQGPGLAPELHGRAFERGWQGAHDRDRAFNGEGGLGLTIARQLTEAQGGVVTVESEEGGGATFVVWLPIGLDARLADVVSDDLIHARVRPWPGAETPAAV